MSNSPSKGPGAGLRHRPALEVEPGVGVARLVPDAGRRPGARVGVARVVDAQQARGDRLVGVVAQLPGEVAGDLVALADLEQRRLHPGADLLGQRAAGPE